MPCLEAVPEFITHNYDPSRPFLKNLCELPPEDAEAVLQDIRASGRRDIKPNYLSRRLATESWLIREKDRCLGPTRLARPIYFFLGNFADGRDLSRPSSFLMPLRMIPEGVVTFTYPDSMASHALATRDVHHGDRQPYHGRIYTKTDIACAIEQYGMPGDRWMTDPSKRYDRFIEVQVWDERPILAFLKGDIGLTAPPCP